jgi:hypothetical protein
MDMPRTRLRKTSGPSALKTPHICIVKRLAQAVVESFGIKGGCRGIGTINKNSSGASSKDAINLIAFLTILKLGDILFDRYWGPEAMLLEHSYVTFRMKWLFDVGDMATVACFTVRSCLRMFGIIKED